MNRKGFMATSLLYSFFFVFLMLMMGILAASVSNRVLVNNIKKDIREDIEGSSSIIKLDIPYKNYRQGDTIEFANESWKVLGINGKIVTLVLDRSLSSEEIALAGGYSTNDSYFECKGSSCLLRNCVKDEIKGNSECYVLTDKRNIYNTPIWKVSGYESQLQNVIYGQSLVGNVVSKWFLSHPGLKIAVEKGKLSVLSFSDGTINYNNELIRIPNSSEATLINSWWNASDYPIHLIDKPSNNKIYVCEYKISNAVSKELETGAYIRPVIEVKMSD